MFRHALHMSAFTHSSITFSSSKTASSYVLDCYPFLSQLHFGFTCQTHSCSVLWHFYVHSAEDCDLGITLQLDFSRIHFDFR